MIVNTSAILAIMLRETGHHRFQVAMADAPVRRLSAGNWIELSAVIVRSRLMPLDRMEDILSEYGLTIEPLTAEQAQIGQSACRRYGIGSGHPAGLNFADCFAYALAKARDEPLLFKGGGFVHTDVVQAVQLP